jgi:hypothetical protein
LQEVIDTGIVSGSRIFIGSPKDFYKAAMGAGFVREEFEKSLGDNLYKLWNRMGSGSYFPPPVKAVPIPKKSGDTRMLGVPTVAERAFCQRFFPWYNAEHHHSIALLTPEVLHYGQAEEVIRRRQEVLNGAYARNPERFVRASPKPQPQPTAVWINAPTSTPAPEEERH